MARHLQLDLSAVQSAGAAAKELKLAARRAEKQERREARKAAAEAVRLEKQSRKAMERQGVKSRRLSLVAAAG